MTCRSQGKKEDAVTLLRDSIRYGPEFADAYSSLASLLAEQVTSSNKIHLQGLSVKSYGAFVQMRKRLPLPWLCLLEEVTSDSAGIPPSVHDVWMMPLCSAQSAQLYAKALIA